MSCKYMHFKLYFCMIKIIENVTRYCFFIIMQFKIQIAGLKFAQLLVENKIN